MYGMLSGQDKFRYNLLGFFSEEVPYCPIVKKMPMSERDPNILVASFNVLDHMQLSQDEIESITVKDWPNDLARKALEMPKFLSSVGVRVGFQLYGVKNFNDFSSDANGNHAFLTCGSGHISIIWQSLTQDSHQAIIDKGYNVDAKSLLSTAIRFRPLSDYCCGIKSTL